ncbi:MAG: UvrD-helicase domain-containing protein, partial [Halieaceae bacterium]
MIADAAQRAAALDTSASFCVSAPAGSGKTELLIQRYLALLSRVNKPEQILAITFTRKAAAEMRERIVGALLAAKEQRTCNGAHEATTRRLAEAVLTHEQANSWQLLDNVVRLNVKTIDSFCASLTRQMPVLSSFGGQASVTDQAGELYIEAVQSLFDELGSNRPEVSDLQELLLHFDNNWDRLQELLVAMLARRDQWREYVGVHHSPDESEAYLRQVVDMLVSDSLQSLESVFLPHQSALLGFLQYQASNSGLHSPEAFPSALSADLQAWRQLASMLLTGGGTWRVSINKSMGFPAGKGEANAQREALAELIDELREVEGLENTLREIFFLPEIGEKNSAWQMVLHLSRVLPLLSAKLLLVFQIHGLVDHSQVAMSALAALGEDEQPTDLAMRLDYSIDHILVDEFQDTAISQFELVRRLTRGWHEFNQTQPATPRTLMIVGDGMQSIYGFRDANVSLFLKARDEGFNGLPLNFLQLRCNFRSRGGVVNWVNETFEAAFPSQDDMARGMVAYTRAEAVKPDDGSVPVTMNAFHGDSAEADEASFVCEQVARAIAEPDCQSIALLGRTRSQLRPLLAVLRAGGINYAAQDIDSLADAPVIVDLMTLCRALANRYDRLAWLALLRAPWCGLMLDDLLRVARWGEGEKHSVIADSMAARELVDALTPDGRKRVEALASAAVWAEQTRDRLGLRAWLEQLWIRLAGPSIPASTDAHADAEQFFQLLELAESEGRGLDIPWLQQRVDRL